MTIEIKKPITRAKLAKAGKMFQNKKGKKGFNADLFFGKINWQMDGVKFQRMVRNEWS